jgi:hypothetical protein
MISDPDAAALTWLLSAGRDGPAILAVHRVDPLGQPVPRPEAMVVRDGDELCLHDVDALGRAVPRPRLRVITDGGKASLYAVDPLGRPMRTRDLAWREEPGGLALCEADPRGRAEPRPLYLLRTGEEPAIYVPNTAGSLPARPLYRIRATASGHALHEVAPTGEAQPRPARLWVER